jgi:hypothetical protein
MEFVMIGVVVSTVSMLLLQRVASAMRSEQMMGTLEALLTSPTSPATIQAGSIALDLLLIPVRMAALLVLVAITFGLDFRLGGVVPAMAVFASRIPSSARATGLTSDSVWIQPGAPGHPPAVGAGGAGRRHGEHRHGILVCTDGEHGGTTRGH